MRQSEQADAIIQEIHALRTERQERLQRDLHFIDAEYDRRLRRVHAGILGSVTKPTCLRRRCCSAIRRALRLRRSVVRAM